MAASPGQTANLFYQKPADIGTATFTQVGFVRATLSTPQSRDSEVVTPHGDTVSTSITSPVLKHEAINFEGNFDIAHATHDETTGLLNHWLNNTTFGFSLRGPGYSAPSTDVIIWSGELTAFNREYPEGAGVVKFSGTFMPSGKFIMEGTIYGTVQS